MEQGREKSGFDALPRIGPMPPEAVDAQPASDTFR